MINEAAIKIGSLEVEPPNDKVLKHQYGGHQDEKFVGISYYAIDPSIEEDILKKTIPESYIKHFYVMWMEINTPYIPPHTDSNVLSVINIYINTNDAKTTFYSICASNPRLLKITNQTDGSMYDESDLEEICSFTADPYDMWILNIKKPHSVSAPTNNNNNTVRTAYCIYSYDLDYETVKRIILTK